MGRLFDVIQARQAVHNALKAGKARPVGKGKGRRKPPKGAVVVKLPPAVPRGTWKQALAPAQRKSKSWIYQVGPDKYMLVAAPAGLGDDLEEEILRLEAGGYDLEGLEALEGFWKKFKGFWKKIGRGLKWIAKKILPIALGVAGAAVGMPGVGSAMAGGMTALFSGSKSQVRQMMKEGLVAAGPPPQVAEAAWQQRIAEIPIAQKGEEQAKSLVAVGTSTGGKVAIGVGLAAAIGGALYFGSKRKGRGA